jgi:hypothetical protein
MLRMEREASKALIGFGFSDLALLNAECAGPMMPSASRCAQRQFTQAHDQTTTDIFETPIKTPGLAITDSGQ